MVFLDRREGDGYVYFHAGGKPGRRKILNEGDEGWRPSFTAIPVIDFADIDSPDFDKRKALADELADAAENVGFFVAVNTPVSTELAEETFQAFEDFFALPIEEKEKVAWSKTPGARGYESFNETADKNSKQANLRESFFIGEDYTEEEQWQGPIPDGIKEQNIWPDAMPQLRVAVYMYYHKILPFARSLLHLFALALGLDETALDAEHKFPIMALRCNHYPPQKPDDLSHGFNAHADFSCTPFCKPQHSLLALILRNSVHTCSSTRAGWFAGAQPQRCVSPARHRASPLTGDRRPLDRGACSHRRPSL